MSQVKFHDFDGIKKMDSALDASFAKDDSQWLLNHGGKTQETSKRALLKSLILIQ